MKNADVLSEEFATQLIEVQSQLAFQEDTVQRLDDVVTQQQRRIDELTRLTERLAQRLADLTAMVEVQAPDQPPPHY